MTLKISRFEERVYPINCNEKPWLLERTYIDGSYSKFARLVFLGSNKQFEILSHHILFLSFDAIAQIFNNAHQGGGFCKKEQVAGHAEHVKGDNLLVILRSVNSVRVKNFMRACFKLFDYIESMRSKPKAHNSDLDYDLSKPVMQTIINLNNLSKFIKDPIGFYLNE